MAIPCQGFTFTWGGAPLYEVQQLEANLQRDLPVGRTTTWTPKLGEVRLLGFSMINLGSTEYGRRKRLVITAPVNGVPTTLFDADCIYRDTTLTAAANDAVTFAHVFVMQDTVGAATNP